MIRPVKHSASRLAKIRLGGIDPKFKGPYARMPWWEYERLVKAGVVDPLTGRDYTYTDAPALTAKPVSESHF